MVMTIYIIGRIKGISKLLCNGNILWISLHIEYLHVLPKLINNSSDAFNCKLFIGLMSYLVSMSICMQQDSHMSMIPGIGFLYGCMIKVHFVKTSFFTFFIMNNE